MKTRLIPSLTILAAFTAGAAAQTPSLTDIAKAEKARRAKVRAKVGEVKSYSDGGKAPSEPAAEEATAAAPEAAAPAADPGKKEKTSEELAAERQKEWTEKVTQAQDQIKELDTQIAADERNLGSMINITPARADLAARIEANKKKLADLKKSLVDLEEERRKAGIPRPR